MTTETLSRAQFAELAGVNRSTVTRHCATVLEAAMVGNKIDPDHPAAIEYLKSRAAAMTPPAATGLDPLHEEAVEACRRTGQWSVSSLRREMSIGYTRAHRIFGVIRNLGLVPVEVPEPTTVHEPQPLGPRIPRGGEVRNHNKKTEALQELNERLAGQKPDEPVVLPGHENFEIPEDIRAFADMTLRQLLAQFGTEEAFCTWLKASKEIEAVDEKRLKNSKTKGELISRTLVSTHIIDVYDSAHLRILSAGAKSVTAAVIAKHASGIDTPLIEDYVSETLGSFIRPVKNKIKRALKENA